MSNKELYAKSCEECDHGKSCWCDNCQLNEGDTKEPWCSYCEVEFASYRYEGEEYCSECLLDKLERDSEISTYDIKHYHIDGEHIGDDSDLEQVAGRVAECLNIEAIKE